MERYIEQLIEDLRNAALQAPDDPFENGDMDDEEAFELEMEQTERFVDGPQEKLSDIVGIPKSHLPAPALLAEGQKEVIIPELIALLNAYNFYPEYPEKVPYAMLYEAIYNIWNDEFVQMTFGQVHIEFCNYDEDNCPFPGYCDLCKENQLRNKIIPENEFNIQANPLKGDELQIDADFNQIQREYYKNSGITDEEGFVPGIHNYCDRWCERCDFTDKCRVFDMEDEMRKMLEKGDNDMISDDEDETDKPEEEDEDDDTDLIDEMEYFDEFDDDFDSDADDFFSAHQKADRHPMIQIAYAYSLSSLNWLIQREKELENGFTAQLALGFADDVLEAEEVMSWYQTFIYAKLKRALSGYYEMEDFEDADYDMNGSAKVALIGIDRSIDAATTLLRHLKEHREKIKTFRDQLEKIRTMAEELFPDARSFIRPGFDEI